ncbi:hypothetical protein L1987_83393 [Smallanthus sonchifolius]|uniref:Uncharacterized protein n=1 Tax=Smallanthus sonchifolius TaxID=185202 RepID=A0ACB8YC84_9ASTR|nr:hypothetical protein L1987_83393 [Smallanthus sonchifolius]
MERSRSFAENLEMGNHGTINKNYDYTMQIQRDGESFKCWGKFLHPKIAKKAKNTTKGKAEHEVSDDDFVTPRNKKFKATSRLRFGIAKSGENLGTQNHGAFKDFAKNLEMGNLGAINKNYDYTMQVS